MKQPQPPANSHFQPTFDSTLKDPGWEQILNNLANLENQRSLDVYAKKMDAEENTPENLT